MKIKNIIKLAVISAISLITISAYATPYLCTQTFSGQDCGTGNSVMLGLNCAPNTDPGDPTASSVASWDAYCDALTHGSGVACRSTAYNAAYNAAVCACDVGYTGSTCSACDTSGGYISYGGSCVRDIEVVKDPADGFYGNTGTPGSPTWLSMSTSPGGATGSIQYNNSGAFGGVGAIGETATDLTVTPTLNATPYTKGRNLVLESGTPTTEGVGGDIYVKPHHSLSAGSWINGSDIYLYHDYVNMNGTNRDGRIYVISNSAGALNQATIQIWDNIISGYQDAAGHESELTLSGAPGYPGSSNTGKNLNLYVGKGDGVAGNGKIYFGSSERTDVSTLTNTKLLELQIEPTLTSQPNAFFQGVLPASNRDGFWVGMTANQGYDSGATARDGGSLILGAGKGINGGADGSIITVFQFVDAAPPVPGFVFNYASVDDLLGIEVLSTSTFSGPGEYNGKNVAISSGQAETNGGTGGIGGNITFYSGSAAGSGDNVSGSISSYLGVATGSGAQGKFVYGVDTSPLVTNVFDVTLGATHKTTLFNSYFDSDLSSIAYRFKVNSSLSNGIMFQIDDGAATPEFRILRNGGVNITTKSSTELNPPASLTVTSANRTGLATSGAYPIIDVGAGIYAEWDTSSDPTIDAGYMVRLNQPQFSASNASTMAEAATLYVEAAPNVTGGLTATKTYAGLFGGSLGLIDDDDARTQSGFEINLGNTGLTTASIAGINIQMQIKGAQSGIAVSQTSNGLPASAIASGFSEQQIKHASDDATSMYSGYTASMDSTAGGSANSAAFVSVAADHGSYAYDFITVEKDMIIYAMNMGSGDGYGISIIGSDGVGVDKNGGIVKLKGGLNTGTGAVGYVQTGTATYTPTYVKSPSDLYVGGRLEVNGPAYFTYTTNPAAYAAKFDGAIQLWNGTVPSVTSLALKFTGTQGNESGAYFDDTNDTIGWYVEGYQVMEMDRLAITGATVNEVRAPRWTSLADSAKFIGAWADGATAIGVKLGNKNTLSTAGSLIAAFYPGDFDASPASTKVAAVGWNGAGYFGATAIGTEWSTSQLVSSNGDLGVDYHTTYDIAGAFESVVGTHDAVGVLGVAKTTNSHAAYGSIFIAKVGTTTDAYQAIAVSADSSDAHSGSNNIAFYANADNASGSFWNVAFYGASGIIYNADPIYAGTVTGDVDYPAALGVFSNGRYGNIVDVNKIGVVGEATADADQDGYGVVGAAVTSSAKQAFGVYGFAKANASTDAHAAIGVVGQVVDAHSAADNIALYGYALNSSGNAFSFYGAAGDIYNGGRYMTLPSTIKSLATSGTLTVDRQDMRVAGNGGAVTSVDLADGPADKDEYITVMGTSDVNTVQIVSGGNCRLAGGVAMVLGYGDMLQLKWDYNIADWLEISRSNN